MTAARPLHPHDGPLADLLAAARAADLDLTGVYVVGGAVRDALLGRPTVDLDLAVEGDAIALAHRLATVLGGHVVATHEFGTATVAAPLAGAPSVRIDLAATRTEAYPAPGALPNVQVGATLAEDLVRRDFTINALAWRPSATAPHDVIDLHRGIADLEAGFVRVLHDASFLDDPTRLLRMVRYAARYDFVVEPHTRDLAEAALATDALSTISAERLHDEFVLLLGEPMTPAIRLAHQLGILARLGLPAPEPRTIDLVAAIDGATGADDIAASLAWPWRLAAFLSPLEPETATAWLHASPLTARDRQRLTEHLRALELRRHPEALGGDVQAQRAAMGNLPDDSLHLLELALPPNLAAAVAGFRTLRAQVHLELTGHDLLELGLQRGPVVGEVLDSLYTLKLEGTVATIEDERAAALELIATRRAEAT